eukprot:m.314059 g.314059  ORF g.314059 m.314059 type:complete len:63 (-) comp16409_c0_seq4:5468-5656(-)
MSSNGIRISSTFDAVEIEPDNPTKTQSLKLTETLSGRSTRTTAIAPRSTQPLCLLWPQHDIC